MGQAIAVRSDYKSGEVRGLAKRAKDAAQARRLLRLEHTHRPALEDNVHRPTRLGSRRSLIVRIGISSSPLRFAVFRMALALLDQFEAAMMAYEHPHHSGGAYFSLQYLFLVVRIAVWTKVMRWFARLLTLFQS